MTREAEAKRRTVGEIKGFIELLHAACGDEKMNAALENLLSRPDANRRAMVRSWVSQLVVQDAPKDFTEAIACLIDDGVAEEAYAVIFQCRR